MKKLLVLIPFILAMCFMFAQVVEYSFVQSNETYTEITGGTVVATGTIDDTQYAIAPPFGFTYNFTAVTAMAMSSNGYLSFNAGTTSFSYNAISSTAVGAGAVAPLSRDLRGGTLGEMRWEVFGTAPERYAVYQWKNWRDYSGSADDSWNFQVILYETSNNIAIRYGTFTWAGTYTNSYQVGLRGATNADFKNRTTTADWNATVPGTLNNATCLVSTNVYPASGLQFAFNYPMATGVPNPAMLVAPANGGWAFTGQTLNWNSGGGMADSYDVYFGTTDPPSFIQNQTANSYVPVLAAGTTYYWQIVPRNSFGPAEGCPVWSFMTPAATQLADSFEATSFPPAGWANGTHGNWTRSTTVAYAKHGVASAYKYGSSTIQYVLSSPRLTITEGSTLDFWSGVSTATGQLQVVYSPDRVTWTQIGANITHAVAATMYRSVIDLSPLAGNNYYIGFRNGLQAVSFYVDAVVGPEITPEAPGPVTLSLPADLAINVNEYTTFTWTAPATGGVPTGYRVYCDTNNPPATLVADVTGLTTTLAAPLAYETMYYWSVEAYNAAGSVAMPTARSFTTRANPIISTFPWNVDFGTIAANWPVLNWTQLSGVYPAAPVAGTFWYQDDWLNVTTPANKAAKINIYGTRGGWLVTPPIAIPADGYELKFDAALMVWNSVSTPVTAGNQADDKFIVFMADNPMMNNPTILREWNNAGSPYVFDNIAAAGENVTLSLTGYSGIKYFAFYGESTVSNGDNDLMVDNVIVREAPAAPIFSVSPMDWDFGIQANNTTSTKEFEVTNTGGGSLDVSSIGISGDYYSILIDPTPVSLAGGQSAIFTVQYAPTMSGTHIGTLTINDNRAVTTIDLFALCYDFPLGQPVEVDIGLWDTATIEVISGQGMNWGDQNLEHPQPPMPAYVESYKMVFQADSPVIFTITLDMIYYYELCLVYMYGGWYGIPSIEGEFMVNWDSYSGEDIILYLTNPWRTLIIDSNYSAAIYLDGVNTGFFSPYVFNDPVSGVYSLHLEDVDWTPECYDLDVDSQFPNSPIWLYFQGSMIPHNVGVLYPENQAVIEKNPFEADSSVTLQWHYVSGPVPDGFNLYWNDDPEPISLDGSINSWESPLLGEGVYSWKIVPYVDDPNYYRNERESPSREKPSMSEIDTADSLRGFAYNSPLWTFSIVTLPLPPQIAVNPSTISFNNVALNYMATKSLVVSNFGEDPLSIFSISANNVAFSIGLPEGFSFPIEIAGSDSVVIQVRFTPLLLQSYNANVYIVSDDPLNGIFVIPTNGSGYNLAASFIADPLSGEIPLAVQFTDTSVGDILTWEWDFGDGNTSNEASPLHTYTQKGFYTVGLTVYDEYTSRYATYVDFIHATARPLMTANDMDGHQFDKTYLFESSVAYELMLESTGTDSLIILNAYWKSQQRETSFAFSFGTFEEPIAPGESRSFIVTFNPLFEGTLADTLCIVNNSENIPLLELPFSGRGYRLYASFGAAPYIGDVPLPIQFTDYSTEDIIQWQWDFGDGSTSSEQHPLHIYYIKGDYEVTLTVSDGAHYDTVTQMVTAIAHPLLDYNDVGSVNFGIVYLDDLSSVHTVIIQSTGTDTLFINSISFRDQSQVFHFSSDHLGSPILPGQTASVNVWFQPIYQGTYNDSLMIVTNAENTPVIFVKLLGRGEYVPPKAPENVELVMVGNNAMISWDAVTENIYNTPLNPDYYLVFYNGSSDPESGLFYYLAWTPNLTHTHDRVGLHAQNMFYRVRAYKYYGRELFRPEDFPALEGLTEAEVLVILDP